MGLPYSGLPHVLAVDDVIPAELVQRVLNKCNDAVALVGAEHKLAGPDAGLHDVITIPVAVAQIVLPSGAAALESHDLATHYSVGLVGSPRWEVARVEDYDDPTQTVLSFTVTVAVPQSVLLLGAACTVRGRWGQQRGNVPAVSTGSHSAAFAAWPADYGGEEAVSVTLALFGLRKA